MEKRLGQFYQCLLAISEKLVQKILHKIHKFLNLVLTHLKSKQLVELDYFLKIPKKESKDQNKK